MMLKKRNILSLAFGITFCLSSFAPGPEFGYFNKYCATSAQNCAYSCAHRFASSSIRRLYKYNHMQQPFYHATISPVTLLNFRKFSDGIEPVLLSAVGTVVLGNIYGLPLIIFGGLGTIFLLHEKDEKEKNKLTEIEAREKNMIEGMEQILKQRINLVPEESKKQLEELNETLQKMKKRANFIELLLRDDEDSRKELRKLLFLPNKRAKKALLISKEDQKAAIDLLLNDKPNNELNDNLPPNQSRYRISFFSLPCSDSEPKILNWSDKKEYVFSGIRRQQTDLASMQCAIKQVMQSNTITYDMLQDCNLNQANRLSRGEK